jgi:hypothetical protein
VFESFINYIDKFGPEILVIQFGFLVILSTLFLWLWFANRRKYHNLKHAIPANVVKSYLDSIIQNSTALKSSLFRGGGQDLNGVPSVMPLHNLFGGDSLAISGAPSTALMEELNQKKALIASLESQLAAAQSAQREFESKLTTAQQSLTDAQKKIRELEALLAKSKAGGGGNDEALKQELAMVTRERDELRERLKEFEIIADDLANLKRLQQENEQLKRSLKAKGGEALESFDGPAAAPAAAPADVSDLLADLGNDNPAADSTALEEFLETPSEATASEDDDAFERAAAMMAEGNEEAEPVQNKPKSEKTPEDLLSEFEKMLG